jgi:hypothetical protein
MRRGQIKHLLYEHCLNGRIDKQLLREQFNDLNNVEPIVHCRDCKFYKQLDSDCPYCGEDGYYKEFPGENDFCSNAERKDEVDGGENG